MTLWVGLTHPALTKLTFMDYLLTMLRNLLRRKLSCDNYVSGRYPPSATVAGRSVTITDELS